MRVVLLPASVWHHLETFGRWPTDPPVFRPAAAATCIPTAVERIVIKAAQRAGLE